MRQTLFGLSMDYANARNPATLTDIDPIYNADLPAKVDLIA